MKRQKPSKLLQNPQQYKHIDDAEWNRLQELTTFERAARQNNFKAIAGVDEAGRGPLAGPVVAAACIIPEHRYVVGVDDSKKLTSLQRQNLFDQITQDNEIIFGIGIVHHDEIDRINILQATIVAMHQAIKMLACSPDYLLVDGLQLPNSPAPCQKIIRGDQVSQSIAAASIIAKVTRDRMMIKYHEQWPLYGFDKHKGYGTAAHVKAISIHGRCPIHRMSFKLRGQYVI